MTKGEITVKLNRADMVLIAGSITALKAIVYNGAVKYHSENKTPEEYASAIRDMGIPDVIAAALIADRDLEIAGKFNAALSAPDIPEDLREYQ